ncbi:hypothetical protein [Pannonibacter indicus]|uniref:globin domain-containing protein n=1 Tax=Pannonibacter indicus TaxID=466044 RepID=UPI0039195814
MTLYIELGGRSVIERAVRQVVNARSGSQSGISGMFTPQQTAQASEDLTEFLTFLFGGSPIYEGPAIHLSFSCLCTSHAAFDEVRDLFTRELTLRPQTAGLRPQVHAALEQIRHHAVRQPHPARAQERPQFQARSF